MQNSPYPTPTMLVAEPEQLVPVAANLTLLQYHSEASLCTYNVWQMRRGFMRLQATFRMRKLTRDYRKMRARVYGFQVRHGRVFSLLCCFSVLNCLRRVLQHDFSVVILNVPLALTKIYGDSDFSLTRTGCLTCARTSFCWSYLSRL